MATPAVLLPSLVVEWCQKTLAGFGAAIAVDKDRIAVGINDEGNSPARVCVGRFDGSRVEWEATLAPRPPDDPRRWPLWGQTIAISGERVAVGGMFGVSVAPADAPIHVFERRQGVWKLTSLVEDPGHSSDGHNSWGAQVGLYGDVLLVSSFGATETDNRGVLRAFRQTGGRWRVASERFSGVDTGYFGNTLAMRGAHVAVTDPGRAGSVLLFELKGDSLEERQRILAADLPGKRGIGDAVAFSERWLAFQAYQLEPRLHEVHVYARQADRWQFRYIVPAPTGPTAPRYFGDRIGFVGEKLLASTEEGTVSIFEEGAVQPSKILRSAPSPSESKLHLHSAVSHGWLLVTGTEKVYGYPLKDL